MKLLTRFSARMLAVCSGVLGACSVLVMTASAEGETASSGTTTAQQQGLGAMLLSLSPFIIALFLLWLILLRPQQKREKEAQKMRENVRVGDEICTAGGLVGIVLDVKEDTVVIETGGDRSKIRVKKWAIHENITQMEEAAQAEKERKAARQKGITTAAAEESGKKKKDKE